MLFGGIRRLPEGQGAYPRPEGAACTEWLAADGRFHLDHRGALALGEAATPELAILRRRAEMDGLREDLASLEETAALLDGTVEAVTSMI